MVTDITETSQLPRHDAMAAPGAACVDLGVVTDSVMRSFSGVIPRERVERLLSDLLEQEFSTARVTAFMPIFLHRVACETLRREAQSPSVTAAEPQARMRLAQPR